VTEAEWDELMDVNVRGLFFACQAAGRHMLSQGSGRIVNVSSQAGSVGIRRHAAYCASKGAVEQLTRVLALEWSAGGVTVNAVAPTFIRTPGTAERLDQPDTWPMSCRNSRWSRRDDHGGRRGGDLPGFTGREPDHWRGARGRRGWTAQ
jgi:NAD(P)-dependent dehydrogenase (short-subunit alcohol dehydrogenase family)